MRIEVLYFASMAEALGLSREAVDLEPGATVASLWQTLVARHPELGGVAYRPLAACDMDWAEWERSLDGVREVAFLPPVSGG